MCVSAGGGLAGAAPARIATCGGSVAHPTGVIMPNSEAIPPLLTWADPHPGVRHRHNAAIGIIIEIDLGVVGVAEVVVPPVDHAGEQGVVLAFQLHGPPAGGGL